MAPECLFSLIVPSRGRPESLRRFLASVAETAAELDTIEVVLVSDADDPDTAQVDGQGLRLNRVVVAPGLTMGALNQAGYEGASGRYLMLLNDDVVVRTPGWDRTIHTCFRNFPDDILLVHVNDTVFQKALCTFPIVSRRFCEFVGGICPADYRRYRIDDHIEDLFNLLGLLGERRSLYLPHVVFEHGNYVVNPAGVRQYFSEPTILASDARIFDAWLCWRKEQALRLKSCLAGGAVRGWWRRRLAKVQDALALRVPERLRVVTVEEGAMKDEG